MLRRSSLAAAFGILGLSAAVVPAAELPLPTAPAEVAGSENWQPEPGLSGAVTVKIPLIAASPDDPDNYYDAFFYRRKQFVFGRRGDRLYFNFHDGGNWAAYIDSDPDFRLEPGRFYHLAFTLGVHREPSQGELWTEIVLYLDGREAARRRMMDAAPAAVSAPVESGQAVTFGQGWGFAGESAGGALYDRTLSGEEVEKLALAEKRVRPAFETEPELSESVQRELAELRAGLAELPPAGRPAGEGIVAALETAARLGQEAIFERTAAAFRHWAGGPATELPEQLGDFELFPGRESLLILAADPAAGFAGIVGWRDLAAGREVLDAARTEFWSVKAKQGTRTQIFSGRSPEGKSALAGKPERRDDGGFFRIDWSWPELAVRADFAFRPGDGDRLEYTLDVQSKPIGPALEEVGFPVVKFPDFENGTGNLLIPAMSGALKTDAVRQRASYSGFYPTGHVSMQLGAWYDEAGGVYFATEDGRARAKSLTFRAEKENLAARYAWPVARPAAGEPAIFRPGAPAVLELFRGDWYDAGLIYRRFLERDATWFRPDPGRRESPAWFRENTLWLSFYYAPDAPEKLRKLREYFNLPFAAHYYNYLGKFDRDYPHHRLNPENFRHFRELRAMGVRVVPYANGRLWETLDRRDEDFEYSSVGQPNAVKEAGGSGATERYGGALFGVMCPAAPPWRERLCRLADYLLGFGVDGVYLDQVAAARPRLCFDPLHPHAPGDGDAWHMGGYRPLLLNIRRLLREKYPEAVLTSEDNAEPYVDLMDGLLAWRWMYDGYVPLFILCYGDRVEFVGRAFKGEDPEALNAKIANQLVNGEQLGWCGINFLSEPSRTEFRRFVKYAMHVRLALLPCFQQGRLARPPQIEPLSRRRLRWGNFGERHVSTPAIESAAYRLEDREFLIFCNTTDQEQSAKIFRPYPAAGRRIHGFSTHAAGFTGSFEGNLRRELSLQPGEIQVWLTGSAGAAGLAAEAARLADQFSSMLGFRSDRDPFQPEKETESP